MTPDEWFADAPESQRQVLDALRKLIPSSAAGVVEEFKWSRPCYSTPAGMFCYLQRTKNNVTLGFQRGASLKDPKKLLDGTGKDMRHIKISAAGRTGSAGLAAVDQAGGRARVAAATPNPALRLTSEVTDGTLQADRARRPAVPGDAA